MTALSRLLQLADTAFPTGAFAHSLGLEAGHAAGGLRDERDLERLLRRHLEGLTTGDLVVVRAAHDRAAHDRAAHDRAAHDRAAHDRASHNRASAVASGLVPDGGCAASLVRDVTSNAATEDRNLTATDPDDDNVTATDGGSTLEALIALDREIDATRATRETREASRATGERFLIAAVELVDDDALHALHAAVDAGETPGTLPVAWGVACAAVGVGAGEAVRAHAFTTLSALAAAGQRLVPLGGVATQRALWRAGDAIDDAVATSAAVDPSEPCSFVPELDVRSAQHERQRVRIFIS